ncbi:MAG: sialidase family protein [candidate division Zixibacteria bacterium]
MDKYIANSSATNPLGISTGRKCFRVTSGQYANRLAILYASSSSNIVLVSADPPYTNISSPTTIVTDSADMPFDAEMDSDGNIYFAYTIGTSNNLGFVKLTFSGGVWSVGSPVIVYNADDNYYPSLLKLTSDEIGIAFTRESGGNKYINYKKSTDDGSSWGTVSDPGDTLTSGAASAFGQLLESQGFVYTFYTEGGTGFGYRRRSVSGSTWESAVSLATGSGFSENFDTAVNPDGRIGTAYATSSGLMFREYSGSVWSGEMSLESNTVSNPSVTYQGGIPFVTYSRSVGSNMDVVYYTKKEEDSFSTPAILDSRKSFFQSLLLYDESAGSIEDLTSAGSSADSADILHSGTGAMMVDSGDSIFFGMDRPFHALNLILSTAGEGGEVLWRYFTGQTWQSFTPSSGAWHFTTTNHDVLLWADYSSIPDDWQKKILNGAAMYWVAATVTTAYTTAPIGSQITAASDLGAVSVKD